MRSDMPDHERVAIRRGLRHDFSADVAAGAGTVVYDERLAQTLGQLFRDRPRHDVGRARRRKRQFQRTGLLG